jgi:hypothetical protein
MVFAQSYDDDDTFDALRVEIILLRAAQIDTRAHALKYAENGDD